MQAVGLLARLNDIDLMLDSLRTQLAEVSEALREPESLAAARRALAEAELALDRSKARQQELEPRQMDANAKLRRAEQRLYGGNVRNPRELEDAERDVQQLRHQRGQAEDDLLEALLAVDAAAQRHAELQIELSRQTADWDAKRVALQSQQAGLSGRMAEARVRQGAARRAVPPNLLSIYDALRARRGGRAVTTLDGDECSACQVSVPPTKIEAARYGDDLVYCDNCGRLLWCE